MFSSDDKFTPASLSRLKEVVHRKRPIVFWIGAGASRWAGLLSWRESARKMQKSFAKMVSDFPETAAQACIDSKKFPEFFQYCKNADNALYHRSLVEQFSLATPGPVYAQLIESLKGISPLHIVTTNIDLCLEQNLARIIHESA